MGRFILQLMQSSKDTVHGWWFAFRENELLVRITGPSVRVPQASTLGDLRLDPEHKQYIGLLDGKPCYAVWLTSATAAPEGMVFKGLRGLFGVIEDELFWIAARAFQIADWDRNNNYCGRCGHPTRSSSRERAKECPACGLKSYPRISPAVIVAVIRGNRILLARAFRFPVKIYSVIAGFVEPGETLEECIRREIKEEVNIEVKNIRYFGSQPWPFPHSLMIAFTAEYAKGSIKIDDEEIMDAGWFAPHDLPPIPGRISIARRLIDWFVKNHT